MHYVIFYKSIGTLHDFMGRSNYTIYKIKHNYVRFLSAYVRRVEDLMPEEFSLLLINNKSPITPITLSAKPDSCANPLFGITREQELSNDYSIQTALAYCEVLLGNLRTPSFDGQSLISD